jgi:hypothetical protein
MIKVTKHKKLCAQMNFLGKEISALTHSSLSSTTQRKREFSKPYHTEESLDILSFISLF